MGTLLPPEARCILVTGCGGFIGAAMTRYLLDKYPNLAVVGLDSIEYCVSLNTLAQLHSYAPRFALIRGSITDAGVVASIFADYDIIQVVHLAAESHVDRSFGTPGEFLDANVRGTQVLLEACRVRLSPPLFLHVSTDEVYGDACAIGIEVDESTELLPTNPYSASKAAAEMVVRAYSRSFQLPTLMVRCSNVYGPQQYLEKIIPAFSLAISQGQTCRLQGSGKNSRRYMYITDACEAIDVVRTQGSIGQVYNIGTSDELTNLGVFEILKNIAAVATPTAPKARLRFTDDRPFNDLRYTMDTSKVRALGWQPRTQLEWGLEQTYRFYAENPRWFDSSSS